LAGEDFGHHSPGFLASERLTVIGNAVERVKDHG
jgi:hypothetical protein